MNNFFNLIKNIFILGLGNILPKFTTFLTLPLLTKYLTTEQYGIYDYVLTISSLIIPILSLQIDQGVFRFLINEKNKKNREIIISNTLIYILIIEIITFFICMCIFQTQGIVFKILFAFYVMFELFNVYLKQLVRGFRETKIYSFSTLISTIMNIICILIFVLLLNKSLNGALIAITISSMSSCFICIIFINPLKYFKFSNLNKTIIKEILAYSTPLVPNAISWWVLQASNRLIVVNFLGLTANAMISVANKIPSLINIIYSTFNLAWQESASIIENKKESEKFYSLVFDRLFEFLTGFMLIMFAFSKILFNILVDSKYQNAFVFVPYLLIAAYISCYSYYFGGILVALKQSKNIGKTSIASAVFNVFIHIVLIKYFDLYAYCIATILAYLLMTLSRAISVNKYFKITYNVKKIILYLLLMLISINIFCFNRVTSFGFNILISILLFSIMNRNTILLIISYIKKKLKFSDN